MAVEGTVRRRALVSLAAFLVVAATAAGAVLVANATVFGAASFVRVYLDALARGDVAGALSLPGVDPLGASTALLHPDALGELEIDDVREVRESGGVHAVEATWSTPAGSGTSVFRVERVGATAGVFAEWGFAESPLGVLDLTLRHEDRVQVNALETRLGSISASPHPLAVFVPGAYTVSHDSRYFTSEPVTVVAGLPGARVPAAVAAEADAPLLAAVDRAARQYLDACAQATVLFPPGCPFGRFEGNRLASEPRWSIAEYPHVEIEATTGEPRWRTPALSGVAHLVVDVRSLFDGSVTTLDERVPFDTAFELRFGPGDRLEVVPVDTL